jgi:hypothetical protein
MVDIILKSVGEAALKEAEKNGWKIDAKIATSVASTLIGYEATKIVGQFDDDIDTYRPEEQDMVTCSRIVRDSVITSIFTTAGWMANNAIGESIDKSDLKFY